MSDDPRVRRLLALKESIHSVEGKAQERKAVEKRQRKSRVDGRALRATGRTEVFPFRCRPELIERIKKAAGKSNMSIASWMERVIETALEDDADA